MVNNYLSFEVDILSDYYKNIRCDQKSADDFKTNYSDRELTMSVQVGGMEY